jgi:hypothetical protein
VLITSAAGAIRTTLCKGLRGSWRHLRLTHIWPLQYLANREEAFVSDIDDPTALERIMQDAHQTGMIGSYSLEGLFRVNARCSMRPSRRAWSSARSNHVFRAYLDNRERLTVAAAEAG